jgi:protocatechuate 3,4-dioxygenase beta subunit
MCVWLAICWIRNPVQELRNKRAVPPRTLRLMSEVSRRSVLRGVGGGLIGLGGLQALLNSGSALTPPSGFLDVEERESLASLLQEQRPMTPERDRGPFAFLGAPYRGKVSPAMCSGKPMVVHGQIFGHDSKQPLTDARLEVWHADAAGQYSMDKRGDYRARLLADESGYYEFETIHPFQYQLGPNRWRSPHIHFMIAASGYKTLVTQLFFDGDPMQDDDFLFREELKMPVERRQVEGKELEVVKFDIVMEPGTGIKELRFGEVF